LRAGKTRLFGLELQRRAAEVDRRGRSAVSVLL
jgi:hypothetical protein